MADSTKGRLADDISYIYYSFDLDSSIRYARISGEFARKCGDVNLLAQSYNSVGVCMINKSALMSALENFNEAYELYHSANNKQGEAKMLNNLGVIYTELGEIKNSIEKYKLSYSINKSIETWDVASFALYNIAINEITDKQLDSARFHASELMALRKLHPEMIHPAPVYAQLFIESNQLDSALHYARMAVNDQLLKNETYHRISSTITLADILGKTGRYEEADIQLQVAEDLIKELGAYESNVSFWPVKADIRYKQGRFREAFEYQVKFNQLKDSLDKENQMNILLEVKEKYETDRMQREIQEQGNVLAENKIWISSIFFIACTILGGFIVVLYFLKRNRKLNRVLKFQNSQISLQRQKIISSITYAKKIQQSTLPKEREFSNLFKESFIYFKPKDIISGDFYAFHQIDGKIYVAAIDCTGHGVPGAFMSLIANTKLNRVLNELNERDPGRILNMMHQEIMEALQQEKSEDNAQDGLEMSLCVIDRINQKIQYAGAGNSILIVGNDEIKEYKGGPLGIGGNYAKYAQLNRAPLFETQEIFYSEKETLIMYSDGFYDQIGGPDNKKLNKVRFRSFIQSISSQSLNKANVECEKYISNWRMKQPQTDDMMLIGIRL
ncbi:MAG: SpoIIE family protein phosphatase [Flavobacteriales bacterium]